MTVVELLNHTAIAGLDPTMFLDTMHHAIAHTTADWSQTLSHWANDATVLAQRFDTDPLRGTRQVIANFFQTGRAWAFLAGLIFGYIIRSVTSYG
jgi:hypothetical protein